MDFTTNLWESITDERGDGARVKSGEEVYEEAGSFLSATTR